MAEENQNDKKVHPVKFREADHLTGVKTWHEKHTAHLSIGQRIADGLAKGMGSWTFIIIQTIIVTVWVVFNIVAYIYRWDPYPFILLNLLFSTQAAYSAPIIMMAQNRQNDRDRFQASEDFKTNVEAKNEIEELQKAIARIETDQLAEILKKLDEIQPGK
ncbi:MAG: DUF1003 domain-containing protein [Candidatus Staskawiczbacteria bacterium]|nr:DUF1003 domain-containing protein [Candidatus Staskawiczbacteria bacterium]